jgi:hypothetical protein
MQLAENRSGRCRSARVAAGHRSTWEARPLPEENCRQPAFVVIKVNGPRMNAPDRVGRRAAAANLHRDAGTVRLLTNHAVVLGWAAPDAAGTVVTFPMTGELITADATCVSPRHRAAARDWLDEARVVDPLEHRRRRQKSLRAPVTP